MFERFTERARQVVVLAQEEAREHHHTQIYINHIAVGLLREEHGLAAQVMKANGMLQGDISYAGFLEVTNRDARVTIPFAAQAKAAMECSLREALSLGHNYIGTEHILLALLRDRDDFFGVSPEKLREDICAALSGPGVRSKRPEPVEPAPVDDLGEVVKRIVDDAIVLGKSLHAAYEIISKG